MLFKYYKIVIVLSIVLFNSVVFSQSNVDWKLQTEKRFFQILEAPSPNQLESMKVELWTVQPGVTLTTAFGHSAIRVYFNKEYDENDYYLEFGMYDPSVAFIISVLKGDAVYKVNVIPTEVAYTAWDSSGRGVHSIVFNLEPAQKEKLLKEILDVYQKNKDGYLYHNFTNNCVTFIRDILSNSLQQKLGYKYREEKRDTWRERVIPYSSSIVWLNFSEVLLFDRDTDIQRDEYELTYLPDDLEKAVENSNLSFEKKEVLPHRWPPQPNNGHVLWIIIFLTILALSLPYQPLRKYEYIANKLFSIVSTLGGTYSLLIVSTTSFDFMDNSITWLVLNPIDIIFFKEYDKLNNKKVFWYLFIFRIFLLVTALALEFTYFPQSIGNLLFLSIYFYICFFIKYYKEIKFK
jgi:hypothetical protein